MDKDITSQSWAMLTGESWETNFNRLIQIKTEFVGISNLGIYLPYVVGYDIKGNLVFAKANDKKVNHVYSIMRLSINEEYNKKVCSLDMSFPGEYKPQRISRENRFYYKWTSKSVSIKKLIATFDIDEIRKHAESLLVECQRFNFMYCK